MIDSDTEAYHHHARELRDACVTAIPDWLERVLEPLLLRSGVDRGGLDAARRAVLDGATRRLDALATADPDTPMSGPLELVRQSTAPVQEWLSTAGVPQPHRDEWDMRMNPDDRYALGPIAFTDLSDAVHRAGITWGAAKAHMHLRRRAEGGND